MFNFSEDMLPRHFPRAHLPKSAKAKTDEAAVVIPQPTLPGVSLLFSNERNVKPQQPFRKCTGQQDIRQRSDSMEAVFLCKKLVKFETDSLNVRRHDPNERKVPIRAPNLELSYFEPQPKASSKAEFVIRSLQDRALSSDLKENCFSQPRDNQHQFHGNKSNRHAHQKATKVEFNSHELIGDQRRHAYDETLLNILKEQQHFIKVQKQFILEQEILNMEQQKQICILQRQVQQLLLQNEDLKSQQSERKFRIENEMTSEDMLPVFKTEKTASELMNFRWGMSKFAKDDNDEANTTNTGMEKNTPYTRFPSEINSTDMFNYKISKCVSSNPHSDVSITAQAFICETSSHFTTSQIAAERSLVLNMLGMKYKRSEDAGSSNTGQRYFCHGQSSSNRTDQISENVASEVHDYLVRHGLIRRTF